MRIPRWGVCLLGVGCSGFVGCSQTGWLRPGGPADVKTVASLDGKPVATVAGQPGSGSALRDEPDDLEPPRAAGARISGRVFDDGGRAVPNAKVRLVVGGSDRGRVNFATTDRSGAFTLHGVRPGLNYTLVAEYQADDGMMSGRVQARAPEHDVRIVLGARDPEPASESRGSKILPAHRRSSLFSGDESDDFPAVARPRVPVAEDEPDREPPAEEAASYSSPPTPKSAARLAAAAPSGPIRAGWSVRQQPSSTAAARPREIAAADDPREGPPAPDDSGRADADSENPLPPALEPVDSAPSASAGRVRSNVYGRDGLRTSAAQRTARAGRAGRSSDEDLSAIDRPSRSTGAPPRPIADDAFPRVTKRSRVEVDPDAADGQEPAEPSEPTPPRPRSTRRPTWRELSITPDRVPVDEAVHRSSGAEDEADAPGVVRLAGGPSSQGESADEPTAMDVKDQLRPPRRVNAEVAEEVRPRRVRPLAGPTMAKERPAPLTGAKATGPVCRLDPGRRRVVELRLQGLDGKMVSLRDIDADVILLDFWGSWCRECRKSIEHHRELQEQLGGRSVQVIGIACEKGPTLEARRDAAAAAAGKLGINYPVLVTTMDGACPVQQALQVQFYPSMVLVDREGRILQFEQGATDTTLGRIDRTIARAVRDGDGRVE